MIGLFYYTAEIKVLVFILNLEDEKTREGDYKGHPIEVPVGLCSVQKWAWQNGNDKRFGDLSERQLVSLYVLSGLLHNALNCKQLA